MKHLLFLAVLLICAPVAFGQAVTGFSGGSQYDSYYGSAAGDVVGWRFTVAQEMEVTDLGVWNNDQTGGLESSHETGIWNSSQTLLASVVVDNTGTVVGDWIYEAITPIILSPGETYTIGSSYVSGDNDWYISSASSMTTDPDVTFIESTYPASGELGFVFPASSSSSFGRFGPNFIFNLTGLESATWGSIKTSLQ
jgi:hypothetical protein